MAPFIKYTKFGKNLKNYDKGNVFNYVAVSDDGTVAFEIRLDTSFVSDLPCVIQAMSASMFDASTWSSNLKHEEITEKEFWAAYKMYMVRMVEHFKKHTNGQVQKTDS